LGTKIIEVGEYCINMEMIINSVITFLAALLVYWLGLKAYYKQKEYENVRSRYLDNGVEIVISQVDYALGVFRHNWMLMLRTLRQYRELESQVSINDFLAQFREIEQNKFQLAPIYKIKPILNDDVLWIAYQSVFSFVGTTNDKIKADFAGVLREILEHPEKADKEGFLKEAENFSKDINEEAQKYYVIISVLHEISEILEKGKYSTESIYNLHKTEECKEFVKTLHQHFPAEEDAQQGV